MLKEIILINSAKFNFARVRLDKDLFFLGTNGNGKTTFIRTIHFLYSADVKSLDIPRDKESFKEYYFKYDNSYIIYVFDTFFIFLHKTSNDINKIFSKQKFNLNRIIKDGKLLDLSQIKSYLKEASLTKKVSGVSEYSDIIYGINKKYLDFKIANIKDKEMFLKLFNAVFNVDKAIIDSKSIKKAIFSSINLSDDSKFFEPDEYIYKMNEYISKYRFFKSMGQNNQNIEKLKHLKPTILSLEDDLLLLSKKINYRQKYELQLLAQKENQKQKIITNLENTKQKLKLKDKILDKFRYKIIEKIGDLTSQLNEIKKLKLKYNPQTLNEKKELLLNENNFILQRNKLQEDIIKLKVGFEDSIKSIGNEINEIKNIITFDLGEEEKRYISFNIQNLNYEEKKEKLNFDFENIIQKLNLKIQKNDEEIIELKKEIENIEKMYNQSKNYLNQQISSLQTSKYQLNENLNSDIKQQNQKIFTYQSQINTLLHNKSKIKRNFEDKKIELNQNYQKEIKEINDNINNLENQLNTPKDSFKEFLEENIYNWEEKIYPIIDETLLSISVDELQPKIISNTIFGIEINKKNLKTILSKSEIEQKLSILDSKKETITIAYQNSFQDLENNLDETLQKNKFSIQELENKIIFINQTIQKLKTNFENKNQKINNQINSLYNEIEQLQIQKTSKTKTIQIQTNTLKQENNLLLKEIKTQKNILKSKLQKLDIEKQNKINKIKQQAKKIYNQKFKEYTQKIKKLESKKYTFSNDKRLQELEEQLKIIDNQLNEIIKVKLFLDEYEQEKEKLNNELILTQSLQKHQIFKKQFIDRMITKIEKLKTNIENIKIQLETINKELNKISQGLNKKVEVLSQEELKNDEFLLDLKITFEKTKNSHQTNLINLKTLLDKLNKIQGLQKYDIYFEVNLIDNLLKDINPILINIDNLIELNDISLKTMKEAESASFSNFIKNDIRQKLELFSNAEDRFISLVSKINKELKKVDFEVIKEIKFSLSSNDRNIAKMLNEIKDEMANIGTLYNKDSLFFEHKSSFKSLETLLELFNDIKKQLNSDKISLSDTLNLSLEFIENGIKKTNITQIKNESSTGGSMLLKIAIAISILKVYIKEAKNIFYLIIDEVSRLHSQNQKKLKTFANQSGFKIIFVTPEPVFADAKELLYYKFRKVTNGFEVIELNK